MEGVQSSIDVASMFCGMTQGQLMELVNHLLPGLLQRFLHGVPDGLARSRQLFSCRPSPVGSVSGLLGGNEERRTF